jgi:hypothetical protein
VRNPEDVATLVNGLVVVAVLVHLLTKNGWQRRTLLFRLWAVFWGTLAIAYAPFALVLLHVVSPETAKLCSALGVVWPVLLLVISEVIVRDPATLRPVVAMGWFVGYLALGCVAFALAPISERFVAMYTAWALVQYAIRYRKAMQSQAPVVTGLLLLFAVIAVVAGDMPPTPEGQAPFILAMGILKLVWFYTGDRLLNRGSEGTPTFG